VNAPQLDNFVESSSKGTKEVAATPSKGEAESLLYSPTPKTNEQLPSGITSPTTKLLAKNMR
jgi:hypothetical protein